MTPAHWFAPPFNLGMVDALSPVWLREIRSRILQGFRFAPGDQAHLDKLLAFMPLGQLPVAATVVDAGCGFGAVSEAIARKHPSFKFILLNLSSRQLADAVRGPAFAHMVGDFHDIHEIADAAVDMVMFNYSICHADHDVALREAARIVRPGGRLFLFDYARLTGTNVGFENALGARAVAPEVLLAMAARHGWENGVLLAPEGSDALFRQLVGDDAAYDNLFCHLRPIVGQWTRS